MVKKTRVNLSNGLPLVIIEIPGSNSLVTSFWTKAGNRADTLGKEGMAHFMEHLLLKKTKKYSTEADLATVLEKVGAHHTGTTSKDWLNLSIESSNKDLDLTARVLSEIVFNPLIDKKGFEAERKVIFEEQVRKSSTPADLVWDIWFKIFFAGSPINISGLGTKESLKSIVFKDTTNFWNKYFLAKNSLILVSGGIDLENATKIIEKHFGSKKMKPSEAIPIYKYKDTDKIIIEKKSLPQANMLLSFRTFGGPETKESLALLLLRRIFAVGWSSRVSQRLRIKESLIYGWNSRLIRYLDTGAFILNIPTAKENFPKMMKILCEELVKIRDGGITNEELDLAKSYIEGSVLSSVETSYDYADWYAVDELHWPNTADSPEIRVEKFKSATKREVESAARKYITKENWHLAVVGDIKEEDIKIEL